MPPYISGLPRFIELIPIHVTSQHSRAQALPDIVTLKRILILAPALLAAFLVQSYFWVPTYEQQTLGNPDRLGQYITASIGDAGILNPTLSADSASSQIENLVFEGLLDRDEELRFRGRLALSWEVYEEAYLYVNESAVIPRLGKAKAADVADFLRREKERDNIRDPGLRASLDNIREISVLPAGEFVTFGNEKGDKDTGEKGVKIRVHPPERIKLNLASVDQDLFHNLSLLLGKNYFTSFRAEKYISVEPGVEREKVVDRAGPFLSAVEANPVLLFHLRPGVRFHDGHLFDAYDVKFTYDAIMNPKNLSPRIADYEPVKEVEVIDPLTVRIVYKRLYSPALGTWGMGILPEHILGSEARIREAGRLGEDPDTFTMRQSAFCRHPIGCGPFRFREWKSDQYIALEGFEDYWENPPNYHTYLFRIIPDLLAQEMEFYAGTIDSYSVQPHQVKRLRADPGFQGFSGVSLGYTYIGYNMRRPPFDDVRVRRALGMAINVEKIIDFILFGQGERITGPFAKQTDYYNHTIQPLPFDPEGALGLLEEAGWRRNGDGWLEKNGKRFEFTLITNSGNDLRKAILAIAQDAWKKIGIDVRTDIVEWSVFIQERVDKADFDALILGWVMGIEPDLYQIWHSSQTNPYQLNFVGFKNSEADRLIIKIRREYDHHKQIAYCHKLHEIIAREQPYTFLYVGKWTAILDKRIVIRELDDRGNPRYKRLEPTKTGDYSFHFNKWTKLPEAPDFALD